MLAICGATKSSSGRLFKERARERTGKIGDKQRRKAREKEGAGGGLSEMKFT